MTSEKSQIKFAKSERTGELIGFVSRHSKTRQLKGVREDSRYGKQICVLAEDLKGTIEPNVLYSVELKPMHKAKGYVVVAATPVQFPATVETIIVPKTLYKVTVSFGNKTNNIGEFLAIVEAVKYILRHPEAPRIIYSDSITAITWYRNKQTASSRRCEQLQLAEIFLKVMAAKIDDIQVLHWDNREWGETPADFGNKQIKSTDNTLKLPIWKSHE